MRLFKTKPKAKLEPIPNHSPVNFIRAVVCKPGIARIEMHVVGTEGLWIEYDSEQFDGLLRHLHRIRGDI